ncbi:MAG: FecR family protein [Saprospiraceae bacterium]|nr:FecR family protein [Bacteroidia bacterium]NNE15569.1 FecR family protein [Saprospiraceae bacterium]NNL92726.1 FecR family protein [Saprospiraceae bacterium]
MNIDKIILKVINNSASTEEYEMLESWKKESQENLEFLKTMSEKYKDVNYQDFDKQKAWSSVESQIGDKKPGMIKWIAAILVLGLMLGAYFYFKSDKRIDVFQSQNETQHYALKDNSEIWLNRNSLVSYESEFINERRVALEGEAYFEIEANKENPFIIELNETDFIKVIGTKFNVVNTIDEFDLTVFSGIVEFHALNRVIILEKDDRIVKVNGAFTKIKNRNLNTLSWKNKELVFDNEFISRVFPALERHFGVSIVPPQNADLSSCRLRSKYTQENISEVFKELEKIYDLDYTISEKQVVITSFKCN